MLRDSESASNENEPQYYSSRALGLNSFMKVV